MSSSDRARPRAALACLAVALAVLPACTARPLYGSDATTVSALAPDGRMAALRGRIAISESNTRTDQVVRNALLFRLNQGNEVSQPLYEVRLTVAGNETGIAVEPGGIQTSSLYRMTGRYQLVRLSDGQVIDAASRNSTVPFDRTSQQFQSQRALLDARRQAADDLAAKLEFPIVRALQQTGS
jgi:LPS-assembly lipoprotein